MVEINVRHVIYLKIDSHSFRYEMSIEITGVIYTHRITDSHSTGSELQIFQILSGICGRGAADRVRLVTTMWDEVDDQSTAEQTEDRLKDEWRSLLNAGASYQRFTNSSESAWDIVRGLGYERKALLLQVELVDGTKLERTTAGRHAPGDAV